MVLAGYGVDDGEGVARYDDFSMVGNMMRSVDSPQEQNTLFSRWAAMNVL